MISFANAAIADWLGLEVDAIVGRQVAYHSDSIATTAGGLLTGLCPSPAALQGHQSVGTISCVARDGGLRRRRAQFVPLELSDELGGELRDKSNDESNESGHAAPVLIFVERVDLTTEQLAELVSGGSPDGLHQAIRQFRSNRAARTPLTLMGLAATTRKLRSQFDAAAASGCNVLITGGTSGDRRELAEAIHDTVSQSSSRGDGELLPLEGSLIGWEEIEEAIGSLSRQSPTCSLLLLDVDQMAEDLQVAAANKLAKLPAARLIATTAHSPPQLVTELDALTATLSLWIPPLAARREDLPLLVQWFVEQNNVNSGKQIAGVSDDALEALINYPLREVQQLGEFVAAGHQACEQATIQLGDLPPAVNQAKLAAELSQPTETVDLDTLIADIEREAVCRALSVAQDNRAEAARLLGLTRQRFYRLVDRLGISATPGEEDQP